MSGEEDRPQPVAETIERWNRDDLPGRAKEALLDLVNAKADRVDPAAVARSDLSEWIVLPADEYVELVEVALLAERDRGEVIGSIERGSLIWIKGGTTVVEQTQAQNLAHQITARVGHDEWILLVCEDRPAVFHVPGGGDVEEIDGD